MKDVLIALLPATIGSIYFFRLGAVINIIAGVVGAVGAEYAMQKFNMFLSFECTIKGILA